MSFFCGIFPGFFSRVFSGLEKNPLNCFWFIFPRIFTPKKQVLALDTIQSCNFISYVFDFFIYHISCSFSFIIVHLSYFAYHISLVILYHISYQKNLIHSAAFVGHLWGWSFASGEWGLNTFFFGFWSFDFWLTLEVPTTWQETRYNRKNSGQWKRRPAKFNSGEVLILF